MSGDGVGRLSEASLPPGSRADSPAVTIVALGDSTTAGTPGFRSPVEVPPDGEGDVTSQFAWGLMQAEPSWRVLNRGVNRERTEAIARRFDRDVLSHVPQVTAGSESRPYPGVSRPYPVLVLLAGVNDVFDGDDPATVQAALGAMYDRACAAGLRVVACTILPFDTATPDQNARMHAINVWIRDTASATPGMAYCDTRAAAASADDADRLADSPDGLHPGVEGHRRMADALLPVLRLLSEAPLPSS